jgi:aconitate hydratase
VNFGVLPAVFDDPADAESLATGDVLALRDARRAIASGAPIAVRNATRDRVVRVRHDLSRRQIDVLLAGGLINRARSRPRP